jgi:hypothetical protein
MSDNSDSEFECSEPAVKKKPSKNTASNAAGRVGKMEQKPAVSAKEKSDAKEKKMRLEMETPQQKIDRETATHLVQTAFGKGHVAKMMHEELPNAFVPFGMRVGAGEYQPCAARSHCTGGCRSLLRLGPGAMRI